MIRRPSAARPGIESIADSYELVESGIQPTQLISLESVHLAPVRPALVLGDDRFERRKVAPVVDLEVVVNGDIAGLALVGRGEPDVIGRRDADLDWKADPLVVTVDPAAQSPQDRWDCRAWHGVFALLEPDASWRGEHRVRDIGELARRKGAC